MAREEDVIAAGVGCRRETTADELERVVRLALGAFDLPAGRLEVIATESEKARDPALREVARRLAVRLVACTAAELDLIGGRVLSHSKEALKAKGLPSIAEASALVAAGTNGRLLGPRVATERATCAIAIGER